MREGKLLQEAVNYCEKNGVKFYACNKNYPEETIQPGDIRKLAVDLFIDDRNVGGLLDWGIIYKIIKSGTNTIRNIDSVDMDKSYKRKKNWLIQLGEAWDKARGYRY